MINVTTKVNGKDFAIELNNPNFKKVESMSELKNSDRLTAEKGTAALSKFYNYLFTDIVGVSSANINGTKTEFNTVLALLVDKQTNKPTGKHAYVSLSSLTRSNFVYSDDVTNEVKSIGTQLGIPEWNDTALSQLDLLKENVFNKYFEFTEEKDFVRPVFSDGTVSYANSTGGRLRVQKIACFKESTQQVDTK